MFLEVRVAKDPTEWNTVVDSNPYAVLRHRYEFCASTKNAFPLIIKDRNRFFLFPFRILKVLKSFRIATSPMYYLASLLPDTKALDLIPQVLDCVADFLEKAYLDYFSACVPVFWSAKYTSLMNSWFKGRRASVQIIYVYMINTRDATFEEIWRSRFKRRNREEIRKAEREGVSVIKIDTIEGIQQWIDDIFRCNVSTLGRQGRWGAFPDSYKEVVLYELVEAKKMLGKYFNIYGALYRGHLIAYLIVQEYNKLMEPTKAASRTEFLYKHPNDVIVAHLVKEACERGFHWVEYGFDRISREGKIPSLYAGIQMWRRKFGFDEIPMPIYRLGLTRSGKALQRLYSGREYLITRSASIPESIRGLLLKLYAPRHRKLFSFLNV